MSIRQANDAHSVPKILLNDSLTKRKAKI